MFIPYLTIFLASLTAINIGYFLFNVLKLGAQKFDTLKFPIALALGILFLAFLGFITSIIDNEYRFTFVLIALLISNLGSLYSNCKNLIIVNYKYIAFLLLTSSFYYLLTTVTVKFPDKLVDGPYVFKSHTDNVKIQLLTGNLPADNYVPYIVGEYLFNNISFSKERPIIPGQEVSNRPILMSLIYLPLRVILANEVGNIQTIPKFKYLGSEFPDTSSLYKERPFHIFLAVGILLNSLIFIGLLSFLDSMKMDSRNKLLASLVAVTSPYYISQIIFTWPKSLAGFFIVLSACIFLSNRKSALIPIFLGLAYWSHPYAVVFMVGFLLFTVLEDFKLKIFSFKNTLKLTSYYLVTIFPWFIWTKAILNLPSDLISQNLFRDIDFINFMWVRVNNLYRLISPIFLNVYPFNGDQILQNYIVTLPGIVGILFFFFLIFAIYKSYSSIKYLLIYFIVIPGILITIIFTNQAVPALHGFQPIGILLLGIIFVYLRSNYSKNLILLIVVLQIIINILLINFRIITLGIRSPSAVTKVSENEVKHDSYLLSLNNYPDFKVKNEKFKPHFNVPISVNGALLDSIWMNPPASIVFDNIFIPPGVELAGSIAIHPSVWGESNADGSQFNIKIISDGISSFLFSKQVDPFSNSSDKRWIPFVIDLKKYSGKTVSIILNVADGGKGSDYADWCLWGDLKLKFNDK